MTSKIISLKVSNIKRIKAVDITPRESLVVIGGRNAQGKSSVLDSIAYVIGGAKLCPEQPLRRGSEKGSIRADLGDFVATKYFDPKSARLEVTSKDGLSLKRPQTLLDELAGDKQALFDPIAFVRRPPKDQREVLCRLAGLDLSELDAKRADAYEQRKEAKALYKRQEAHYDSLPCHPEAPAEPIDTADIAAEIAESQKKEDQKKDLRQRIMCAVAGYDSTLGNAAALREEAERLDKKAKQTKLQIVELQAAYDALPDRSPTHLRELLAQAQETNVKVAQNQAHAEAKDSLNTAKAMAEPWEDAIIELDNQRLEQIKNAKMPLPELSVSDKCVLYNGLPLAQASSAEQLKISVAIGVALNPKLRVLLVREGSLLDKESLKTLGEIAAEAQAQVWVERVSQGDECQVIIEDGVIVDG